MYLRTPKRYTARGRQRPGCGVISLRWLWLYLLAPVVIVASALIWDYRADVSQAIGNQISKIKLPAINAPTATPTLPAVDLEARIRSTLDAGNLNDTIDAMRSYTDSVPNETVWHSILARTLIMRSYGRDQKLLDQANQAGLSAINANPEVAAGWASEALVLDWSNQSQQALSYALRAKDLGDTSGMTSAVMAGIYFSLGDAKQADSLTDEALKTNPNLAYAYYVKAQIASASGDQKTAISLLRQGLDISKADHTQWGGYIADQLALSYVSAGQLDLAVSLLVEASQRDKDDPALYFRLSKVYNQQGVYDKATEAAQACIDRDKDYAGCHVLLIKLEYIDKQYEKATQSAQRAIELGTTETSAYYYGGASYIKLNKCNDAIPMFRAGLALAEKSTASNSASIRSDFTEALGECGVSTGAQLIQTEAATAAATEKATTPPARTPTPKKR